jgi:hypothetical protein
MGSSWTALPDDAEVLVTYRYRDVRELNAADFKNLGGPEGTPKHVFHFNIPHRVTVAVAKVLPAGEFDVTVPEPEAPLDDAPDESGDQEH